ncbi:MAG: Holliday junction resolvase RuvX [Patescibacteria group bacterium]
MNYLSIDYGTKNVGLAVNNGTEIAFPFKSVPNKNAISEIFEICDEEMIDRIVVGMPSKMDRTAGALAEEIKAFVENLKEEIKLPVDFEDEILSSEQAGKMMADYSGKYEKDAVEAAVILQTYLDKNG